MSRLVVLDAGHGGNDPGAVGADGTKESELALAVVNALHLELKLRGFDVERTREKDVFVSLKGRADFANKLGAHAFVSVHFNASQNTTAKGCWVLFANGSWKGQNLAGAIHQAMVPAGPPMVHPDESPWTNKRRLAVLRLTNMPAVLVECAFVSNPGELEKVKEPGWTQETAARIADGIERWFKGPKAEQAA